MRPLRTSAFRDVWTYGCLAVLLLHWIAPLFAEPSLWGASTWRGVPSGWRTLFVVVGATLIYLAGARSVDRLFFRPAFSRRAVCVALAALTIAFWFLRSEVHWANFTLIVKNTARPIITLKHPLSTAAAGVLQRLFAFFKGDFAGIEAIAVSSIASGVAFLLGAHVLGRELFPESRVKARVCLLILGTAGYAQEFFGVIEGYTPALATQIWTLALLVRFLRLEPEDGRPPSPAPMLLACSISTATFVATIFLWPAVLLAILWRRAWRPLLPSIAAAILPLVAGGVLTQTWGRTKVSFAQRFGSQGGAFVPLRIEKGSGEHFSLLSLGHLDARLNAALLVAPVCFALVLAALLPWRSLAGEDALARRWTACLGLAGLSALSYVVLVHPDMGAAQDWMQNANGYPAILTLLVLLALRGRSDEAAARIGTACVGVALLHLVPWVLVNAGVLA